MRLFKTLYFAGLVNKIYLLENKDTIRVVRGNGTVNEFSLKEITVKKFHAESGLLEL